MMGEFERLAQSVVEELSCRENEGILVSDIPMLIESCCSEAVNCYPGVPSVCHEKLVLLSLKSKLHTKGVGHISFQKALELLVRHMQGSCSGSTRIAVLITDNWDVKALDFWRHNIVRIQHNALVEIYMISGSKVTRIAI